jgi:hypothetical protein
VSRIQLDRRRRKAANGGRTMIIRDPLRIAELLCDWAVYVNFVELEIDGETRHYGLDLTGKVPGLDFNRRNLGQQQDGVFYWLHIAPTADPGTAAVTIDANWRHGGEIAAFEEPLAPGERFDVIRYVHTFVDFPVIIQKALSLMLDDLDREVGVTLSRESEFRLPPR